MFISTYRLNSLLNLHLTPIYPIIFRETKIPHLEGRFTLDMLSVFITKKHSYPAMQFYHNWYTRGFHIFGPLVLEEYLLRNQNACTG